MRGTITISILLIVAFCFGADRDTSAIFQSSEDYFQTTNKSEESTTGIKHFFAPDSDGAYSPKKALLLSAITPGLGHIYVRKPVKALIYFGLEAYHLQQAWHFNELNQYVEDTKSLIGETRWYALTKAEKNQAIIDSTGKDIGMSYWRPKEMRNKRIWWSVGIYFVCMLDAYVDAHLSDFPKGDMEFINDKEIKSRGVRISFSIDRRK